VMSPDDLADMVVAGRIWVTCEFCNRVYEFDEEARRALAS